MTDQPPKARRRGCLFYGCLTSVVLLGLLLGALLLGLHYVKKTVDRFTDTRPMELPTVQMPQAEVRKLKTRVQSFQEAVADHRPSAPLSLTSDDINVLLTHGAEQQPIKGRFYASLEGGQLKGDVSLPLDDLGFSMLKGRYLNGSATFTYSFRNGVLSVSPQTVLVKGAPLPEVWMQQLRHENLAVGVVKDPQAAALLQGLEDIQIKDGTLIILPKQRK